MAATDLAASVVVAETTASLAIVHARKGQADALAKACTGAFGLTPADGPTLVANGAVGFVGVGPGKWLAFERKGKDDWEQRLQRALGDAAYVCDQSGGYILFRLSGPSVRDLISKGAFLDLHRDAFTPGCAAATVIAHIGVTLWCLGDDVFEVLVFRSYAASFRHWLSEAGGEYGLA